MLFYHIPQFCHAILSMHAKWTFRVTFPVPAVHYFNIILSMSGHVWLVLSECDDGSVLLLHSSPPGVRVCGTTLPSRLKGTSQAEQLAIHIMSVYYPDWYERYPDCSVNYNYPTEIPFTTRPSSILINR